MELIKCKLPKSAEIILTSDWHEGSALQYKHGIANVIDYVMSKSNRYMIHGGDTVEAIAVDDKRYQADSVDPDKSVTLRQYQGVIDKLTPLAKAKRLLGIHEGNHDLRWLKVGNFIKELVCKELNVPFGTYSAKYVITDSEEKIKYKIFVTHGNGAVKSAAKDPIQRDANLQANLKMKLQYLAGDCKVMAMGHTHKLIVVEPKHELYLIDDGKKITQGYVTDPGTTKYIHPDHRWYANTGSMVKLYGDRGVSGYAERMMLRPVELGYCVVVVEDYKVIDVRKVVL
ncbi:MAG: hypothetical protein OEY10_00215 [Nitrosopumilus sp.]|nr:hypothetical protein [Nitrosopumilus sp.]